LLFLVGLKLDWRLVRTLGPVALATGLGQVGFTAGFGFLIGLALGLDAVTSIYIAVALTFSSTIIIVKLLTDKRELETLHGRIALGFLIVQDIVVVLAMVVLSTLGHRRGERFERTRRYSGIVGALIGVVAVLALFVRYVADPLMARLCPDAGTGGDLRHRLGGGGRRRRRHDRARQGAGRPWRPACRWAPPLPRHDLGAHDGAARFPAAVLLPLHRRHLDIAELGGELSRAPWSRSSC
jgi:hypothetical protein